MQTTMAHVGVYCKVHLVPEIKKTFDKIDIWNNFLERQSIISLFLTKLFWYLSNALAHNAFKD
jgi:hypothetical protein